MAQIAPPARFTLSEWIDHDDGDTSPSSVPACTNKERMLHAHVVATVQNAQTGFGHWLGGGWRGQAAGGVVSGSPSEEELEAESPRGGEQVHT